MMKPIVFFAGLFLIAGASWAQDPPSRVARLNLVNGAVSFQPASVDDWTSATLNYPLTTGDHLYADQGARAEMHVGSNAIRMSEQTNFGFLNLDDQTAQFRVTQGSVGIRLRSLQDADVWEVDTPNGAITLLRTGDYRVDTDPDRNATMLTVRVGEAEITANGQSFTVRRGETAYFTGEGNQPQVQSANPEDSFDAFCRDRDRREDTLPAPRYVSRDMAGYEDLDANGTWSDVADYGPMWRPRNVSADWAPYRDGHWAWVEPWGWTWIDDASWGFAPFHYGRWAYVGGGWGWYPGAMVGRPVYAPALVAFVGGGNWSVSLNLGGGGGGVAWFPLGPREVYLPSYHHSDLYSRHLNGGSFDNGNRGYMNQRVPGAVIAVSRVDFVGARSVARSGVRVDVNAIRSTRAEFGPGVAPERVSVFGRAGGPVNVARPRDAVFNRPVFARSTPPAPAVAFAAKQRALQDNGGRPLDTESLRSLERSQTRVARPETRSASQVFPGRQQNNGGNGFGRQQQQQGTPAQNDAQPVFGRQQNRMDSRPPNAQPNQQNVQPNAQPNVNQNGGFGRQRAPVPTPVPEQAPVPNVNQNSGFGRGQDRQRAPAASPVPEQAPAPAAAPAVNRNDGFGRRQQQQQQEQRQQQQQQPQQQQQQPQERARPAETQPVPQAAPTVNQNNRFERRQERQAAPPPAASAPAPAAAPAARPAENQRRERRAEPKPAEKVEPPK